MVVASVVRPTFIFIHQHHWISDELAHQFKDSGAIAVVTTAGLLANVTAAQRLAGDLSLTAITVNLGGPVADGTWDFAEMIDAAADAAPITSSSRKTSDAAFMPYSSGTTGLSKGVVLSHRNILANITQTDYPDINHINDTTGEPTAVHTQKRLAKSSPPFQHCV